MLIDKFQDSLTGLETDVTISVDLEEQTVSVSMLFESNYTTSEFNAKKTKRLIEALEHGLSKIQENQ